LISDLSKNENKEINYSEFLAATVSVKDILTHNKLEALFRQFDTKGRGEIKLSDIKKAL
jgi:Ca2+-binding EF-hand superfamily protein